LSSHHRSIASWQNPESPRGIQVQPDLPWRLVRGPGKDNGQQSIQRRRTRRQLLVSMGRRRCRVRQIQAVEGAESGQRLAPVSRPPRVISPEIMLAHRQRQDSVRPQDIVVVDILTARNQAINPLGDQGMNAVLATVRVAVIGEAAR
jgi:hypothetical protein